MLKKTVTYTDFNDVEHTEDLFFNLSKSELMEMELKTAGGLENLIDKISKTEDTPKIVEMFKQIITMSYGIKSDDGKKFVKNDQIVEDFVASAAYDALFMELITDPDAAANFVNGIIPKDIAKQINDQTNGQGKIVDMKPSEKTEQ